MPSIVAITQRIKEIARQLKYNNGIARDIELKEERDILVKELFNITASDPIAIQEITTIMGRYLTCFEAFLFSIKMY